MFEGIEKNLELAKTSWASVQHLHIPLRGYQNLFVSKLLGKQVELAPAEIRFGWWDHLLRGDYMICVAHKTDTIVIDSCMVRDYNSNEDGALDSGLSLADYMLNRVAHSEGTRTINHVACRYGFMPGLMGHEEPAAMSQLGNLLGQESLKKIGRNTLPVDKAVLDAIESEKIEGDQSGLKKLLLNPAYAYYRIDEKMHPPEKEPVEA